MKTLLRVVFVEHAASDAGEIVESLYGFQYIMKREEHRFLHM